MSTRRLIELLNACDLRAEGVPDVEITAITADSRQVIPGALFVAIPGVKQDGAAYAQDARVRGAAAVIGAGGIPVENPRLALARLSAAFYPRQPAFMAAVTGTDGKTSTADFYRQLASLRGHKAASIGTLGTLGEDRAELAPGLNTTPDPPSLHRMLEQLDDAGYTHACMEASSHGLHQHRLDGVRLDAAAFTNLTRDHMDYHGDEEAYFAAKSRLFSELLPAGATAVLNSDDARFGELHALATQNRLKQLTYGKGASELVIEEQAPHARGQRVRLRIFGRAHELDLPLVGGFQVYNMLAALGLLAAQGEDAHALAALLPKLAGVPGRLEPVGGHAAYVDYAHTPAALAGVLKTLRAHTPARLVVVFGCGGDRDRGKRPQMGRAAAELADEVIVTDDNPRSEDPAAIRAEVLEGCPQAKAIADRRAAIYGAVEMLKPGDVLLVAGKGHEKTQTIGAVHHPFDDVETVKEAFAAL